MRKTITIILTGLFLSITAGLIGDSGSIWLTSVSKEKMRMFPETPDFRNYFFLQSIDDNTTIIIGDFTGTAKMIVQIIDDNSDNTIDRVIEYYPETGKYKTFKKTSSSHFFNSNIADLKRKIIDGSIFRENYSYQMNSLDTLRSKIDSGTDIFPSNYGYTVRYFDPDLASTQMSEFFFGKNSGRYDLIFKTNYYKIFNLKITPPAPYSVYCKNSKDPIVIETVESLLKEVAR